MRRGRGERGGEGDHHAEIPDVGAVGVSGAENDFWCAVAVGLDGEDVSVGWVFLVYGGTEIRERRDEFVGLEGPEVIVGAVDGVVVVEGFEGDGTRWGVLSEGVDDGGVFEGDQDVICFEVWEGN